MEWKLETDEDGATLRVRTVAAGEPSDPHLRSLQAIQHIRVRLLSSEGKLLAQTELVPVVSGMAGEGRQSLTLLAQQRLELVPDAVPARVGVEYTLLRAQGEPVEGKLWVQRHHRSGTLELVPEVGFAEDEIVFRLRARRLLPPPQEYFPTSERLRVELFDGIKQLWSSAAGVMFLQVIGEVEPQQPGQEQLYEYRWSAQLGSGEVLPSGHYHVCMSLPAQPRRYVVCFPLEWHGKRTQ